MYGLRMLIILVLMITSVKGQNMIWSKRMGGSSFDYAKSISLDLLGNVYSTGYVTGWSDFDPGSSNYVPTSYGMEDIYISKLDPNGNFIWAVQLGSAGTDMGLSIATDASGNVYTCGKFAGTIDFDPGPGVYNLGSARSFILKLDPNGNFIWAKEFGGVQATSSSISVDKAKNVYTTGYFSNTQDFDPGSGTFNLNSKGFEDIYISKLDSNGNFIWAKQLGGKKDEEGNSIIIDPSGFVYTTGYFNDTCDFDPGTIKYDLISKGLKDIFISKLDANGNFVWVKQIGGGTDDIGNGITLDPSGSVFTTGYYRGTVDFDPGIGTYTLNCPSGQYTFINKLDVAGNFMWTGDYNLGYNWGTTIATDMAGNVYIGGNMYGTVDFDPGVGTYTINSITTGFYDFYICKLSNSGNFIWAAVMGGNNQDYCTSLIPDAFGNVYSTGFFYTTADFDPSPSTFTLTSSGYSDLYVHKMGPGPTTIKEFSNDLDITVYPNPTSNLVNVQLLSPQKNFSVEVVDVLGEIVYTNYFHDVSNVQFELNGPSQLYFLKIRNDLGTQAEFKIIKD